MNGWDCSKITYCGDYGKICGGFNQKGKNKPITKSFAVAPGVYSLELDFIKIDSWDGGETASVDINGVTCWTRNNFKQNEGVQQCGNTASNNAYLEEVSRVSCRDVQVTGTTLTIKIKASVNENVNNEAFGIDNVKLIRTSPELESINPRCSAANGTCLKPFSSLHGILDNINTTSYGTYQLNDALLINEGLYRFAFIGVSKF